MIAFVNSFLSYLIVVVIFAAVMFVGGFVGLKLRDSKDKKAALVAAEAAEATAVDKEA